MQRTLILLITLLILVSGVSFLIESPFSSERLIKTIIAIVLVIVFGIGYAMNKEDEEL